MSGYDIVIAATFTTTTLALALFLYLTIAELRDERDDGSLDEQDPTPTLYDRDYDSFGVPLTFADIVDLDSRR